MTAASCLETFGIEQVRGCVLSLASASASLNAAVPVKCFEEQRDQRFSHAVQKRVYSESNVASRRVLKRCDPCSSDRL